MKVVTSICITDKEPVKTSGYICVELTTILKAVCVINEVNIFDVKGKSRKGMLVTARREYCYLACRFTQLTERNPGGNSLSKIGAEINRSHATVLHHKGKVVSWFRIPGYRLKEKFERIEEELKL